MDRPFVIFLCAGATVMFGTVWLAMGADIPPPPPAPVVAPVETGPAHPDAASPQTIPIRVDTGTSPMTGSPSGAPLNPDAGLANPPVAPPPPVRAPAPVVQPAPASVSAPVPPSIEIGAPTGDAPSPK